MNDTRTPHRTLFNLLDAAERLHGRVAAALGEVGLSYAKYEVLSELQRAERPVSLGVLAHCQQCARSNMTQMVDRLEGEGLVRRIPDPSDRRSVLAELTPEGDALAQKGAERLEQLRGEFAASLGRENCAALDLLLAKLE